MAKNANELLQGILTTVSKIEKKMGDQKPAGGGGAIPSGIKGALTMAGNLIAFGTVKDATKKSFINFMKDISKITEKDKGKNFSSFAEGMVKISSALPDLVKNLKELGNLQQRRVDAGITTLRKLYEFMHEMGDGRHARRVEKAISLFDKIGKSLKEVSKPLKEISLGFLYLGLGILGFAASLLLTAAILKLGKPGDVLLFLGITVIALIVMFGALYLANKMVKGGVHTIADMGLGLIALSIGILSFALTIKFLPMILGGETGGTIAGSLLIMLGIVGAMVLMYGILSLAGTITKKGFTSILWMSLGLAVFSIAIIGMAQVAKMLSTGFTGKDASKEEKDEGKKEILRGLGTMGLIMLSAVALFGILGIPGFSTIIKSGAITMMLMAGALILMSISIGKLVKIGKELEGEKIDVILKHLIGGTIDGFIEGLSSLSGGKKGLLGVGMFMLNSAKIFAGVGVLMAMSLALSMFAKAISAFAQLENMRIIEGYDKDGKPIFGEKVNVTQVADNINYSISTFLQALLDSTEGLTRRKAKAIQKMARALTGRRGILTAVIQFADALKTYAAFGEANEIGYVDYDDQGNEIRKKVKAQVVVDNVIGSFLYFTERLFSKSESEFGDGEPDEAGISGRQRRRMKRMSKALIGKHGILGAIVEFANILELFAKFGENNEMPMLDEKGQPIMEGGKPKTLKMGQIADNIVSALTTFSDTLAEKLETKGNVKDASKAIGKYDKLIEQLSKLSTSMDGLTKMTTTISQLAEGIGLLAVNVDNLNAEKLSQILDKTAAAGSRIVFTSTPTKEETATASVSPTVAAAASGSLPAKQEDWAEISKVIGDQVGAKVAASLKSGQFIFEFDTTKSGGVYYWSPK